MEQTESKKVKQYNMFQNIGYYFRYYRQSIPIFLWICLAEILFGAIQPLFGIYLPKLAVELVEKGVTPGRLWLTLGVFGLLCLSVHVALAAGQGKYSLYNTRRNELIAKLFLKSLRVPYRYVEEGDAKELYWKAMGVVSDGDWCALYKVTYASIDIIQNVIRFVLYGAVLSFLNPWVAVLLLVISLIQYAVGLSKIKYLEKFRGEEADLNKKKNYLFYNAMGNPAAAKDVRIFGMAGWLNKEKDMLLERGRKLAKKKARGDYAYWQMDNLLSVGRDIFAYGYLLKRVFDGAVGAGDFVLYFGAITGFAGFVGSIMYSLAQLRSGSKDTNFYRAYMELPEDDLLTGQRHISELTQPVSIEFRDVSFSYDKNSEKKIFDHFNLKINAGEKLALVGTNGAGKTTFVKLLCGMYEPDEGSIFIGGINRNEFPKKELYELFSVVFQEPFILPVTVAENLTFERDYDSERAWTALKKAGLDEKFLKKGVTMNTFFDKDIDEEGLELSGGEEQRFLLARALYKDAPVLVLDEPTAALDPIAESEIYDNYSRYTNGKTAVFISHRLASTRFSDRIVLLGEGGIIEEGSHQELMRRKGAYADMFDIQSRYYTKSRLEKEVF